MSLYQKYAEARNKVEKAKQSTTTSSFKTISRNKKPIMATRFHRDFNDLDYQIPSTFSLKKTSSTSFTKIQNTRNEGNPQKLRATFRIVSKYHDHLPSPKKSQRKNAVETKNIIDYPDKDSARKDYGLSGFQYSSTIIGKIQNKHSHHIKFDKSPERPQNIQKIWYDKDQELCATVDKDITPHIHNFKSYSAHKVFIPKQSQDKFYDLEPSMKLVKNQSSKNVREFQKVKQRAELQKKLGTMLEYEKNRSLQNDKKPLLNLCRTERKLKISRQIISPERGCYR